MTGDIYYDSDGSGGAPAERIATHANANGFALEANDFAVINGSGAAGIHLVGTASNDTLAGGAGNDTLEGLGGLDSLIGNAGDDVLAGGGDGDDLNGGAGNDRLEGGPGMDWITGGSGADTFAFTAQGVEANLELIRDFATGIDRLELDASVIWNLGPSGSFAAGDARFHAAPGANAAHDASDRIIYNTSNGWLWFDADGTGSSWQPEHFATLQVGATLAATDITVVNGSPRDGVDIVGTNGNDSLVGTEGDDAIEGLAGDDTLEGLAGNDLLIGNEGSDSLVGGNGNDVLEGRDGNDVLLGGPGIDTLRGDEGNDTLDGGPFGAIIRTGAGFDRVLFTNPFPTESNPQTILDFSPGTDELAFDRAAMPALGETGDFGAGDERFHAAPGATSGHDASDRLIYNTSNGWLFFDPDGDGSAAAVRIATVSVGTALTATDITVFDSSTGVHVVGTSGDDSLVGSPGNDTLEGLAGDDTLDGVAGQDILDGGAGNDTYFWRADDFADDALVDSGGVDTVFVHAVVGFGLPDGFENMVVREIVFGDGELRGNASDNLIRNESGSGGFYAGLEGNDTLIGVDGIAEVFEFWSPSGNYGDDLVDGGVGIDLMIVGYDSAVNVDFRTGTVTGGGTAGSGSIAFTSIEFVLSRSFDDSLTANDAGVTMYGGGGNDTLTGGAGDDFLDGEGVLEMWSGETGDDLIIGGAGNDTIDGWDGNNTLDGGAGDDEFQMNGQEGGGQYGHNVIDGREGTDRLRVFADSQFVVDLAAGTLTGGNGVGGGSASLASIEDVEGPGRLLGNAGANRLTGRELDGRGGNDTLEAFSSGFMDTFNFSVAPGSANADQIIDSAPARTGSSSMATRT